NLSPNTLYFYRISTITSNRGGITAYSYFNTPDTNHSPVLNSQIYYFPGDLNGGASISYWATDLDFPPQSITYRVAAQPTNGTLAGPYSGWRSDIGLYESVQYFPNASVRSED